MLFDYRLEEDSHMQMFLGLIIYPTHLNTYVHSFRGDRLWIEVTIKVSIVERPKGYNGPLAWNAEGKQQLNLEAQLAGIYTCPNKLFLTLL